MNFLASYWYLFTTGYVCCIGIVLYLTAKMYNKFLDNLPKSIKEWTIEIAPIFIVCIIGGILKLLGEIGFIASSVSK